MAETEMPHQAETAAQQVARRLAEAGCRHAFGMPGGEVLTVLDALRRAGIAFTLAKHENAAGYMAEGAWHATGAPGLLLTTIGPGLANAINTLVNALQDQTPLILLSGAAGDAEAASYTHQVFNQTALTRSVVKGAFRLSDGAVDIVVEKAIALALADPPGPVHLDLAADLAPKPQPAPKRYATPKPSAAIPAPGPALDAARAQIAAAERPLILAGLGALHHDAGPALLEAAERLGAPVVTTYKAKGLIDENHRLSLGGHGLSPLSDTVVLPLIAEADCVISVGYDPIEMRHGWIDPFAPARHVALLHAQALHGMHGAATAFVGDVGLGLKAVTDGIGRANAVWPGGEPDAARARLAELFADREAWGPHQAFAAARRALPAETVVTVDSGAHRILLSQMWRSPAPRRLLQSSAFCTMGVALPLAIGHKRAQPETPALAVLGDAGLDMVMGELTTARDLGLPLPVMVMVDDSLALIELKQRKTGLENAGVDFPGTDYPALAKAIGGEGFWIDDAASLETQLGAALDRSGLTLLACRIGRKAYDGAF